MSNLSAALAAALQNYSTIADDITGVISGRNFTLQDTMLLTAPYACLSVIDLPSHERPYVGSTDGLVTGQLEVRCISSISEQKAKDLAETVKTYLRSVSSLTWDGSTIAFGATGWMQTPDTADDLSFWLEILTIDYKAAT